MAVDITRLDKGREMATERERSEMEREKLGR